MKSNQAPVRFIHYSDELLRYCFEGNFGPRVSECPQTMTDSEYRLFWNKELVDKCTDSGWSGVREIIRHPVGCKVSKSDVPIALLEAKYCAR